MDKLNHYVKPLNKYAERVP
jgi:receptor expression-enhancing protein 5/6